MFHTFQFHIKKNFFFFSTFCLTDKNSNCVAVNLYNLAPGKGVIIGDSVAIAEPNYSRVDVQVKDEVNKQPTFKGGKTFSQKKLIISPA